LCAIDPPVNLGFPSGSNLARSAARGEYLILLQDDGTVSPGWLEALINVADDHPEAGVVGSVTTWPGGERIMQAGQVIFSDASIMEVAAGEPPRVLDGRGPFAVDTVSSHGMLVRASTWDAIGGLEEGYFPLYMSDATISRRVWERGEAVLCAPAALAGHARGASTRPRFRSFLFERHYGMWCERWADDIASHEPPERDSDDAIKRALARASERWRHARPGPSPAARAKGPYDLDGDDRERLQAGVRFGLLAEDVRAAFADKLEESVDALERRVAELEAERGRLERGLARAAEQVEHLERRSQTLSAIEAGGWWRLRARVLPLIRLARAVRRLRAG
jgi:hypothetical protein